MSLQSTFSVTKIQNRSQLQDNSNTDRSLNLPEKKQTRDSDNKLQWNSEVNEKDKTKVTQCVTETIFFTLMHANVFLGQITDFQVNTANQNKQNFSNWLDFQIFHIFLPQKTCISKAMYYQNSHISINNMKMKRKFNILNS